MKNNDIREVSRVARVPLWRIADEMGIGEMTLTRRMRYEMTEADKQEVIAIIEKLQVEGGVKNANAND